MRAIARYLEKERRQLTAVKLDARIAA